MLGLYQHTHCWGYEGDSRSSDKLLAIGEDEESLISRWNAKQDAERKKLTDEGRHESYLRGVPPNFPQGSNRLEFSGSNGGGWGSVQNTVTIKPIPQFDDQN